ncbi:MAG: Maf family nucleotide pyrophosphatase [Flavobacteriales bacterium]
MKIILGSNSPRRKELLEQLGIPFEIRSVAFEETINQALTHDEIPVDIVNQKLDKMVDTQAADELLICADTLVFHEGQALGKPKSKEDAIAMLQQLSGKTHTVITAVGISFQEKRILFKEHTNVQFEHLTVYDINTYVNRCNPLDKAGSYGIQDWIGLIGVSRIEGSYTNVMGLPTHRIYHELKKFIP